MAKTNKSLSIDAFLSAYRIPDAKERARIVAELQTLGERVVFTERGRAFGCLPQARRIDARSAMPRHVHDFFEIAFVLDGEGRHETDGVVVPVRAGDLFFLGNEAPHGFVLARSESLTVLSIAFLPEFLDSAITFEKLEGGAQFFLLEPFFRAADGAGGRLSLPPDARTRFAGVALAMVDAFTRAYPEPSRILSPLFRAFVLMINAEYARFVAKRPRFHEKREALFREILRFVDARLSRRITLPEIGKAVGLGHTRLAELFKEKQGVTLVEYINRRRVEQAQNLLRTTDLPVIDVAFESGFFDVSNFNRIFKKIAGASPRAFRKSGK